MATFTETIACVCLAWTVIVIVIEAIGIRAIVNNFKKPPPPPASPGLGQNAPHVTIIRPVKGVEPRMLECIASSFQQDYPIEKLSIRLCVESRCDTAYPVLQKIVQDHPAFDACVLVESEDAAMYGPGGYGDTLGPNPKIRNISRAYREAKGDIIWIADCNVWVSNESLGRMVDKLMGYGIGGSPPHPYKFVHQLPIVADMVNYSSAPLDDRQTLLASPSEDGLAADPASSPSSGLLAKVWAQGGGRLDEMFMATTHAKFYGAINAVGVAPCIVGKSNMFRKSQLEQITNPAENPKLAKKNAPTGVDYFSYHICEDHLIGELFWNTKIPGYRSHGMVWGDLVVQPMSGMSVSAYTARRARWLRARKFTVLAATLVEPGVESFLCCAYLSFALTTLPFFNEKFGLPQTWSAMGLVWLTAVTVWMLADRVLFCRLHSGLTMEADASLPFFARGSTNKGGIPARSFLEWLPAWLGREALALPVWVWAVLLGRTVYWRGKAFRVRWDSSVYQVPEDNQARSVRTPEIERAASRNKHRVD